MGKPSKTTKSPMFLDDFVESQCLSMNFEILELNVRKLIPIEAAWPKEKKVLF